MQEILIEMSRSLGRIEARQDEHSETSRKLRDELRLVHRRVTRLERKSGRPPTIELAIKRAMTWLLPLLTLWITGSIDAAIKVFGAIR